MSKYQALVLEDTLSDQLSIEMVLSRFADIEVTYASTPKEFLQALNRQSYRLFVVDIMLNDSLTGIDLMPAINDPGAWVIISSSLDGKDYYEQYKAFNFNKFYLKKPIEEFSFRTHVESFLFSQQLPDNEAIKVKNEAYLMLKQGNYLYKVLFEDIILIETTDHATTVYTHSGKYTTYSALKTFEDLLKNEEFERANRNSLVNLRAVKRIHLKENYLEVGSHQVSISRNNRTLFLEKYQNKAV
jgi:DNA-binding LytR/AlgR family response regulator